MEIKEMVETLRELEIEIDFSKMKIDVINLKEMLSSLDFLKLIIYIEERYAIEFDEKILNEDVINFKNISGYIDNGK